MKRLVCIGDSHASFFSGQDTIQPVYPELSVNRISNLEGVRLGAVLAYSLHKTHTSSQGREKLFQKLKSLDPCQDGVLLVFGEIDCRCHLIKQSDVLGQNLENIIEECVNKYFQVILEIQDMGFKVFVWNVIATSRDDLEGEYPHYGSHLKRNESTVLFNQLLEKKCKLKGIHFVDIFKKLTTKRNYTKGYMLFDGVHLGQLAMPFFVEKLKKICPEFEITAIGKLKWYTVFVREYFKYKIFRIKKYARMILKKVFLGDSVRQKSGQNSSIC